MMVNGQEQQQLIGYACDKCGSAQSSNHHYNTCILPFMGGYVDDDNDYHAPKASAAEKPSDKPKVRVLLNGIISKVLPSDLHKPKPFRTVSKGDVCSVCGAKEPMCGCCTDIDDSDDDAPGAAASHAEPPGSFLPFF